MTRSDRRISDDAGERELVDQIAQLSKLNAPALKERWRTLFDDRPIPRIGRGLMIMAVAYRLQEKVYGSLKPSAERVLGKIIGEHSDRPLPAATRPVGAGTVLIREWRGVRHRVTVDENGAVYRDRRYRSLSEVARAITGTRWSGPRFFGLSARGRESGDGR